MIYHPPKLSQDKSRIWVWLDYLVKWATSERVYIKGWNFEQKASGKYFIPPNIPPSGGGLWPWMYPTHVELDPTLTYSKGTCAYLSPQNPLVTVGLVDLDSTVFCREGKQEGARKGFNPRRKGRNSHHPLLAVLAEAQFILHGWLRSGNTGAARGVVPFLQEALAFLPAGTWLRTVRADSGFFDGIFLDFLEERALPYVVVARMTSTRAASSR